MSFFERVVPAARTEHWTRPEERVSAWLVDVRLERRERALERARVRTGVRDD